jgi:hypothetical protein
MNILVTKTFFDRVSDYQHLKKGFVSFSQFDYAADEV